MTEQVTPPVDPPNPAAAGGSDAGTPPPGFVPEAELERERTRARTFQAEADRQKAENDRLTAAATPAPKDPPAGKESPGFDQDAFLERVYKANAISNAAVALRSEFPKADDSFFSAEKLKTFASPEQLRIAVEADHNRVVEATSATVEEALAKQKAEIFAAHGLKETPGGPAGTGGAAPAGDPTPETVAAMSMAELDEFERTNPEAYARIRDKAFSAQAA